MWVVAMVGQSASEAGKGETVRAGLEKRLVGGLITLVVVITILFVGENGAHFTLVGATKVLRRLSWGSLRLSYGWRCDDRIIR